MPTGVKPWASEMITSSAIRTFSLELAEFGALLLGQGATEKVSGRDVDFDKPAGAVEFLNSC